ncbi:hypothetical protein CR513_39770, partial [Mucuna pruriens]
MVFFMTSNMLNYTMLSPNSMEKVPTCKSILVLVVIKNGLPRIKSIMVGMGNGTTLVYYCTNAWKNFSKNTLFMSPHVLNSIGYRYNQSLATPSKEKGNAFILILIHFSPKFHGLSGKDPHKHLKEFHVVCSTMRPHGILEDYIKKAFPFSLDGASKDWLYLQPILFNT